jgi:hypothetical protein
MNNDDLKDIQEDIEEISDALTTGQRFRNWVLTGAAIMIGFGQWNDTRELAVSMYEDAVSAFTHTVEYNALQRVDVGVTREYLESTVGKPKVVKSSQLDPSIQFEYIFNDKYLLTTIFRGDRLIGYTVICVEPGFTPQLPFSVQQNINQFVLNDMELPTPESFSQDNQNITFYIENHTLGLQGLFLKRSIGMVSFSNEGDETLVTKLHELADAKMFGEEELIVDIIAEVRQGLIPNFYAISNIKSSADKANVSEAELITESLLTKFEYFKFK